jgi:PAS domain S-box-containing protein
MHRFNPLLWPKPPVIWNYAIAVLSISAALIISWWPKLHLQAAPMSLLLCAVMFSAWLGGLRPGLLAAFLSILAFDFYYVPPMGLGATAEELPLLITFSVSAMLVGSLSVAQRSATESLKRARDELKETVRELIRTNQTLTQESFERKRVEEKLRESDAYLHEAQRVSHTGSWSHDFLSGVVTISPEVIRIWGIEPCENASVTEIFFGRMHPEDRPVVEQEYEAARLKKAEFQSNYRIVLPDGEVKNIRSIAHPILNETGDILEFVGAAMDVTAAKEAEEALRQAQADLAHVSRVTTMGELTASLAHEVNQPIAAAVANANACSRWLAGNPPNLEEARAAATRIVRDGRRAADIIKRIRLLFEKNSSEKELVDVNEIIREMAVLLRGEATRYSICIKTELANDLPMVLGDRVQLQQLMMNLFANGIDAMKQVGSMRELVVTSQRTENEHLLVSVSDTGVGLPAEHMDRVFDAFFTTKAHGTGMGLRICRSVVESHCGRLWAAENDPQGASFHFTLPSNAA